jgi:putative membrane protein
MSRITEVGRRPEVLALVCLYAFTVVAVLGYWNFGLNPDRLPPTDWAIGIYQRSFPIFARAQILLSAVVLFVALIRFAGARWLPALGVVYLLSFLAEHVGTGFGIPFSGYSYTGLLGTKLLGRVPFVIPLSWFLMAAPAWIVARRVFPEARQTLARIVLSTFLLMLWDLALDPAMSFLTPYWVWDNPGAFYGMPWVNLAGWAFTGVILMGALELLQRRLDWAGSLPVEWALGYYLAVLLMPLGMVVAAGLWASVGATLAALGVAWVVFRLFGTPVPKSSLVPRPSPEAMAAETAS